ncbi:MAG: RecQ family zinc-binding domain-containing protein, partial [Actinobacteria bacterium]|nr:RecQ family zinc-binding domain-containing protein [Actinomycetota bacterium]
EIDGRSEHFEARLLPLVYGRILAIVRNITPRKQAERTLRRTQVERVREYADSAHCRDLVLRHHFGDLSAEPCGRCDTCSAEGGAEPLETLRDLDGLRPESGVKHRRFGRGTITDLTRDTVTVLFDRVGYRTLATDLVRERQLLKPA